MQAMVITGSRQRAHLLDRPVRRASTDPLRMPAIASLALAIGLLVALLPGMAAAPSGASAQPAPVPAPGPAIQVNR
jgi:hypothetical protein